MKKISLGLLGLVASAAISSASAATVYDTSIVNPPDVYFGNGNTNGHFAVTTTGNIEIGQRAIIRYGAQIVPVNDVYTVPVGPTSQPGKAGSVWGFTFSINTDVDGIGGAAGVTGTHTTLTLHDSLTGATTAGFGYNLSAIGDNTLSPTGFGFQNSEALSFTGIADFAAFLGDPLYDLGADAVYTLTINVRNSDNTVLATNTIFVNAVPEPLTISLFAAGLVGAGALRRRKKVQA